MLPLTFFRHLGGEMVHSWRGTGINKYSEEDPGQGLRLQKGVGKYESVIVGEQSPHLVQAVPGVCRRGLRDTRTWEAGTRSQAEETASLSAHVVKPGAAKAQMMTVLGGLVYSAASELDPFSWCLSETRCPCCKCRLFSNRDLPGDRIHPASPK